MRVSIRLRRHATGHVFTCRALVALAVALCTLGWAGLGSERAKAQTFPSRPVRLVVPYSAGGPADVLARLIGQKLAARWGQQVVVDNRAGANTIIGMEHVARSAPDGHTLIMATTAMAINAAIVPKLPYDTTKDFTPITNLVAGSLLLVVHPSVPAHDLGELIAHAKATPGQLTFGSGGTGSPTHVSGELLKSMAGIDMVHVPYKGMAPALADLLAGHIQLLFSDPLVMLPHVQQGKVRALGVTSTGRYPGAPDIPTLAEAGLPGYESTLWYGILAPGGAPRPTVDALHAAFVHAMQEPDVRERLAKLGTTVVADTPDQFASFIRSELAKWAKATINTRVSGTGAGKS